VPGSALIDPAEVSMFRFSTQTPTSSPEPPGYQRCTERHPGDAGILPLDLELRVLRSSIETTVPSKAKARLLRVSGLYCSTELAALGPAGRPSPSGLASVEDRL